VELGGRRLSGWRRGVVVMACAVAVGSADRAEAQLRPLDPIDWVGLSPARRLLVSAGFAVYEGQRASLAGLEGRLVELGNIAVIWRIDRVAFEVGGTAVRRLEDPASYARAAPGTRNGADPRRDVGDVRIATIVELTRGKAGVVALRFGTRLPTTDNGEGLERDRTDFFSLIGVRLERGPISFAAESGIGIHGARSGIADQVDVWLYGITGAVRVGPIVPSVTLVGQVDGRDGPPIRGNEDLGEVRLGLQLGHRRWVRLLWIRGMQEYSPDHGFSLALGFAH